MDRAMTDEFLEGPDPNEVRKQAKRMCTAAEYQRRYNRSAFYRPNKKQLIFHNSPHKERMLLGANQSGKTHAGAAEMSFHATGRYPQWYEGKKFVPNTRTERTHEFIGWAACTSSLAVRDGLQIKLFGDVTQTDGLGTGLIPLDFIVGRPTMARGISGWVDTVNLRRETGGNAIIRLKSYEQGRTAFQGESVDIIWLDEDPGYPPGDEIYGEALARGVTTDGRICCTMTPILGKTPVRKRYLEASPDRASIKMTLDDVDHLDPATIAAKIANYKPSERATRAYGEDMAGEGAVFEIPEENIKHRLDAATIPDHWRWLAAIDFSHAGLSSTAHPFAWVVGVLDPDADIIYIMHALLLRQMLPANHVAAIKSYPAWDARTTWGHDGNVRDLSTGTTFADIYKKLGLNRTGSHATVPDGGYSFEAGIAAMERRFAEGKLKVAAHLGEWFEEYRSYHRENGKINKIDDDLLSATRQLVMGLREARPLTQLASDGGPSMFQRKRGGNYAYKGSTLGDTGDLPWGA